MRAGLALIGQTVESLTFLERISGKLGTYRVRCKCGTEKVVRARTVLSGIVKTCGCLKAQLSTQRITTHGLSKTPEYRVWWGIIRRCEAPKTNGFHRYGGRGITMCPRWRGSFENFLADMGSRPSPKHSIERIDNDGPYEPGNCRWATAKEQAANTRRNPVVTYKGEQITIPTLYEREEVKVPYVTFYHRIKSGWPIEDAIRLGRQANGYGR